MVPGGDLPRMAMAADRAPKTVSFPTVDQRKSSCFRWRGWLENDEGKVGNKTQPVASSKIGGNGVNLGGFKAKTRGLDRRVVCL